MSRVARQRLDQLLVERGLAPTRSRAQALVLAGQVRVGRGDAGRTDAKPGDLLDPEAPVELLAVDPYVSRGGHKLEAALDAFGIDPAGLVCLDVGASTGGFTDVLLQRGAARVYAVDVGRGQLADRLRRDPRVVSLERTNARALGPDVLGERVDLAVVDVSFISLRLVLGPIVRCLDERGGSDRGPRQAAVRGGPRPDRPRGSSRSGRPPRGPRGRGPGGCGPRHRAARPDRVAAARSRPATASSSFTWRSRRPTTERRSRPRAWRRPGRRRSAS